MNIKANLKHAREKAEMLDLLLECKRLEREHKEKSAIYSSYAEYLKNALKD